MLGRLAEESSDRRREADDITREWSEHQLKMSDRPSKARARSTSRSQPEGLRPSSSVPAGTRPVAARQMGAAAKRKPAPRSSSSRTAGPAQASRHGTRP
jgi:hypothetical protein